MTENPCVPGSIPGPGTNICFKIQALTTPSVARAFLIRCLFLVLCNLFCLVTKVLFSSCQFINFIQEKVLRKVTVPSFIEKQGQYLSCIVSYTKVNGRPPAEADLQRYFKVTPPTVHQMVVSLDNLGLIKRIPGVGRSIEVLLPPKYQT